MTETVNEVLKRINVDEVQKKVGGWIKWPVGRRCPFKTENTVAS